MGNPKRIGQLLLKFRTKRGWTQQEMAAFLGKARDASVSQAQVSFWERGRAMKPSTASSLVRAIADADQQPQAKQAS